MRCVAVVALRDGGAGGGGGCGVGWLVCGVDFEMDSVSDCCARQTLSSESLDGAAHL